MKVKLIYISGEEEIFTAQEVHYCYDSPLKRKQTAFEYINNEATGFTVFNDEIKEFEITE